MTAFPIRVGFIGAGRISDLHVIEYLQNPAARLVGVCDANVARARAKIASWGLRDAERR